jgi:hypothetical protein
MPVTFSQALGPPTKGDLGFPGLPSNPVGFAAAPGYPGSLNSSPPTILSNNTYSFYDFVSGQDLTNLSNVTFIGCRFQSNANGGSNIRIGTLPGPSGGPSDHIVFKYCSFTPLASLHTAPPNAAWPCAGAGKGLNWNLAGYTNYVIPQLDRYQNGFTFGDATSGPVTWDHCDFWGFGNCAIQWNGSTTQMNVVDCWIHDAADPSGSLIDPEHTDGVGFLNGGTLSNVLVKHCTIAAMGPVNAIAFQAGTYNAIQVINNYLTGFANCVDMCHATVGNTNLVFTDNVFGTDIPWSTDGQSALYTDYTANFTGTSNLWRRNTLHVSPGVVWGNNGLSVPPWDSSSNGQFLLPNVTTTSGLSTTDFNG